MQYNDPVTATEIIDAQQSGLFAGIKWYTNRHNHVAECPFYHEVLTEHWREHFRKGILVARDAGFPRSEIPTYDLGQTEYDSVAAAAAQSPWIPAEFYCRDDWVSDLKNMLLAPRTPLTKADTTSIIETTASIDSLTVDQVHSIVKKVEAEVIRRYTEKAVPPDEL